MVHLFMLCVCLFVSLSVVCFWIVAGCYCLLLFGLVWLFVNFVFWILVFVGYFVLLFDRLFVTYLIVVACGLEC